MVTEFDPESPCEWMGCDFPSKKEHHQVRVHTTRGGRAWAVSVGWHSGHYGTLGTSSRKYCGPGDAGYSKAVQWAHKRHATYASQPNAIPMASVSLPTWRRPPKNSGPGLSPAQLLAPRPDVKVDPLPVIETEDID